MMVSLCRTRFILSPTVTKFAEEMERGWFVVCIKPLRWCFQGAEDILCPFTALRTRLVWEEFRYRYRRAREQWVRWRPMSSDGITPVSDNLCLNSEQLIRHDSPVIHCDAVILCWCWRLCCCKGTKVFCFVCILFVCFREPWSGSRPSSPNPTTPTACL